MKMLLVLNILFAAPLSFATSFYIRPFPDFTKTTENILRGKLNGIHVENGVTVDGGKTIYTFATLNIEEVLKGGISGTQITIRKLGGTKDGITLEIPGSVEFTENEEGVYFLSSEREDHSYEITGMELGKFTLEEKDGEQILQGGLLAYSNAPTESDHQHNVNIKDLAANHRTWSLSQLKELIRSEGDSPNSKSSPKTDPRSLKPSDHLDDNRIIQSDNITSQTSTTSLEEKYSLYNDARLWYSLATIAVTLGVFLFLRRK